jgi:PAS domain S-box-containing protein
MNNIQKIIEQLGCTPKEAKVYLATLGLGEAHVTDIASKTKLPRTSIQVIVEKLRKDGLMNFYVRRRYKYWVAENPEHLLSNLRKREEAMRAAMPALAAIRSAHWNKSRSKKDTDGRSGLLQIFAEAAAQPVLIANENVEIEHVNAAWEEQFGFVLEEVRGENPRMLQSGKTPPEVYKRMWEALGAGLMFQSEEIIDKRKDGTFFNLLTTIFPVDREGHTYYIQMLDDITERKRVEALAKNLIKTLKV